MSNKKLNYTLSHAVYNIANTVNNFVVSPSCNYNCNITSKVNDVILLNESYFLIEYKVSIAAAPLTCLIPNWFLSMITSFNIAINSHSFQLNSINFGRTFPMLIQTMRYLEYEDSDYNKFASSQREFYQPLDRIEGGVADDKYLSNSTDIYPIEKCPTNLDIAQQTRLPYSYTSLNLKDIMPIADTVNQVSGLLSFSFVLNYNPQIQSLLAVGQNLGEFTIQKIDFHYFVKTFNMEEIVDIDLSYISSYTYMFGTVNQTFQFNFDANAINADSQRVSVVQSNIQLATNQIYKLLIFPIYTLKPNGAPAIAAPATISYFLKSNQQAAVIAVADYNTDARITNVNKMNSLKGLLTLPGQVGSPLFNERNVRVVVNGNVILPTNVAPIYTSEYFSDYFNYEFGFNGKPVNSNKKPNLFFDFDKYKFFKPIVVDLESATKDNAFNSLTFSFEAYNVFNRVALANGQFTVDLNVNYAIVNKLILGGD